MTAHTEEGIRFVDYIVEKGGEYLAIEVKTGEGARSAAQLAKDAAMAANGARIGKNGAELTGKTLKLETIEWRPF